MTNSIKYPNITVEIISQDGNAFNIIGICTRAMRRHGLTKDEIDNFIAEATSGDYNHLLSVVMSWFDVE